MKLTLTEKMYENLQEKYKNNLFQILKICKIIALERLAILILIRQLENKHWVVQFFGNKVKQVFLN